MKVKLEEAKQKEEVIQDLIHEWEENCPSLEAEVVSLRMNLERVETKKGLNEKIVEGTRKIDQILKSQRSSGNKIGFGYPRT